VISQISEATMAKRIDSIVSDGIVAH